MTLPPPPDRWTIELANAERLEAVAAFGLRNRLSGSPMAAQSGL